MSERINTLPVTPETKRNTLGSILQVSTFKGTLGEKTIELDSSQGRGSLECAADELITRWEKSGGAVLMGKEIFLGDRNLVHANVGPAWPIVAELPKESLALKRTSTVVDEPLGHGVAHPVSGSGQRVWLTTYNWGWNDKPVCSPNDLLIVGGALNSGYWNLLLKGKDRERPLEQISQEQQEALLRVFKLIFPRGGSSAYYNRVKIWEEIKVLPAGLAMEVWRRTSSDLWTDAFPAYDLYTASLLEEAGRKELA